MIVHATFDMVSMEYAIEVPDGSTADEIEHAVLEWLDDNIGMVADDIGESEIWPRSIEEA